MSESREQTSSAQEFGALFVLTGVVAPLLTIALVGGFGFAVWVYQLIAGPPAG